MNANTLTTGEARFSYVHLFKAETAPGSTTPNYSVTALIPKTDAATINAFNAAWNDAVAYGIQNKWGGTQPPVLMGGLKDGDGVKKDGTPYGPECKGCWVLTCKTNETNPPQVVDQNIQPIIDPRKVYSGCYGRVNISLIPYNNSSKGIKAILNCAQFLRDGEPLGGTTVTASEAFGAAAPTGYPGQAQAPAAYPSQAQAPAAYPSQAPAAYPAQAQAPTGYPAQAPAIDPITGQPIMSQNAPMQFAPNGAPIMGM